MDGDSKSLKKLFRICRLNCCELQDEEDQDYVAVELQGLLNMGLNINVHHKGCLPLCEACRSGTEIVVQILLKHGALVNLHDKNKCSPLYIASSQGYLDVVQTLIKHEADVNSKNLTGYPPLLSAVENHHMEVAEVLVEAGAEVNIRRPNICGVEMTLMTFVLLTKKNISFAEMLLHAGVLPHKFEKPISSLLLEFDNGSREFVKKLICVGFKFDCGDWIKCCQLEINKNNADVSNSEKEMVLFLEQEKSNPPSLENMCRIVIRSVLIISKIKRHMQSKVNNLPIPNTLKHFLLLECNT